MSREPVIAARRVVVKVGSSSLTRPDGGLNTERIVELAAVLAAACAEGRELVLVSSGAVAAGLAASGLSARPNDLAGLQAAASVGQGLLIHAYTAQFNQHGIAVGQVLLSADDIARRGHYRNAQRTMFRLLELGVLPIVNENDTVATEEIRFGDNDRLAALVAHLVHADLLVLLSDVDGLYDSDPSDPGARLLPVIAADADLAGVSLTGRGTGVGTGGMATKVAAARMAVSDGVPALVAGAADVAAVFAGEPVGTWFPATGQRRPTRMLWLAHASEVRGQLSLDAGAVTALTERGASLLPAGVTAVSGDFAAGDPVDLCDEAGAVIARGLVNFDAAELPGLLGRSTHDLARELGPAYSRELVHRDDLVLL